MINNKEVYNIVDLTLQCLKKRLDSENTLIIQAEFGYCEPATFSFNPSASESEIHSFEEEYKIIFPWDYKEFLLRHNGAAMFVHPYYGGGIALYGLEEIRKVYIDFDYINLIPDGWVPIGSDNGDMLFLSTYESKHRFSSYLYWTEMLFVDNAIKINMNFERWLERLIICNGRHFWNWESVSLENYYRQLQEHIDNLNDLYGKSYILDYSEK